MGHVKNVIIAGITSDIGRFICLKYLEEGCSVYGTYRKDISKDFLELIHSSGGEAFYCDFSEPTSVEECSIQINNKVDNWDIFISAVGVIKPICSFAQANIDMWEKNVYVNAISQLHLLHNIIEKRNADSSVFFMTSKGVNDAFANHSAYCISKIILIKMCELLDDEIPDCKFIAFNPGFIKTKIIDQETNLNIDKTTSSSSDDENEMKMNRVWKFIRWSADIKKSIVSGRDYFVKYDEWEGDSFAQFLSESPDAFKLRRYMDPWLGNV